MTIKTPDKKRARALQNRTAWSYSECLRCVQTMDEGEIERLILQRELKKDAERELLRPLVLANDSKNA